MLQPVDGPLIRALRLDGPYRIAEIGCGGGGTTLEIHRQAPAGSSVRGYDIVPGLVELARERANGSGPGIDFAVANVATVRPEQPYDRLVSRFSTMFFDDPPAAFGNLLEWLVPGGRFALAVWGPLPDNAWMTVLREVVGELVDLPLPDAATPGPFRYQDAGLLVALLERAGFGEIELADWRGLLAIGGGLSPAEAARFALSAFSSIGELLAARGSDAIAEARHALTDRFSEHVEDGVVRLGARVHLVTGTRP